jgi:hypothetical protein
VDADYLFATSLQRAAFVHRPARENHLAEVVHSSNRAYRLSDKGNRKGDLRNGLAHKVHKPVQNDPTVQPYRSFPSCRRERLYAICRFPIYAFLRQGTGSNDDRIGAEEAGICSSLQRCGPIKPLH